MLTSTEFEQIKRLLSREELTKSEAEERKRDESLKEISKSLRLSWGDSGKVGGITRK